MKKSKVLARVREKVWIDKKALPWGVAKWSLIDFGFDKPRADRQPVTITTVVTRGHAKRKGKGR